MERRWTLEENIGQLFLGGFPGTEITDEFLRLIEKRKLGNVILFSHNIIDKEQVFRLNDRLKQFIRESTKIEPFIALDEEGGAVSRLPAGCAVMPSARAQAKLGDPEKIRKGAAITAAQCLALGFNLNLAPVLDINTSRRNPGIGTRSYGETARQVTELAGVVVDQYRKSGLMCCGKHFPGAGDVSADSHLDLPVLDIDYETLESRELKAFSGLIERELPAIMISHIVVPAIEQAQIPCTISQNVVNGLLRGKMHYRGLIVSDCLEMNAIKDFYGIEKSAVNALNAGIDLICISHTPAYIESSIQEIYRALEDGRLTEERIDDAAARIREAKRVYAQANGMNLQSAVLPDMLDFAEQFFLQTIYCEEGEEPFGLGASPLFVGVENRQLTAIYNKEKVDFAQSLKGRLGGTAVTLCTEPSPQELAGVREAFHRKSALVLGTFNGHLSKGQRQLIDLAGEFLGPVCHIALRDPYDLKYSSRKFAKIALYEYTERSLRAAAGILNTDN